MTSKIKRPDLIGNTNGKGKNPKKGHPGNKYALGKDVGRHKQYDREKVGREFVEWVKTHPDCLTVPHFTTANGYSITRLYAWLEESPEFKELWIEAKQIIGLNRLNATRLTEQQELIEGKKALDKTIYLRHVGNFDFDVKMNDRDEKKFESSLRQKEAETTAISMQNLMNQKPDTIEQK